ncbi:uncharacterized protein LOC135330889 isoform X3 [Halichondria panicea]|uniref:uncharacterized protein LOC135330889 isoform X3 n=1 Tax=Halichondria panicea TaxID=6063 RepID=UPI00312B69E4
MASMSAPRSSDQSIEYKTMVKCASSSLDCIKSSPNSIGTAMFAEGYISEYVRDSVGDTSVSKVDKAQLLLNTITDHVKTDPLAYHGFVEIIRKEGTWASCYLERLQNVYEELSLEARQIEEQCSSDSDASFHSLPDELSSLKIDANVTSKGFICPFCQNCSFESFLQSSCPHAAETEKLECKAFFPFLNCSKIDPEDKKDLEWHLLQDYQKILKSYARLENSLINSLESSEVNIEKLDNFVWNLVVPPQTQQQKRVEKAETVTEIFKSIRPHKSFFNCDIVEEVSKEFGTPADNKLVAKYVATLNEYCKRSVFEVPPVFFQYPSERNDCKLFAFKYTPGNPVTLGDVQIIRRKIASILGINARLLQLCSIEEGCVKMVFLVPEFVVEVIDSITVKQTSALTDLHIEIVPVIDSHQPLPDSITFSDIKKVESLKATNKDLSFFDQRSTISSGYGSSLTDEHRSATMFQLSLLDKVTTIVAVPDKGTVRDAVQPWVKKFGYDFDTIQLRYKQNFCRINMDLSADILTGQHVIAIETKNSFIAIFPDQEDKILPADSSKSIKEVWVSVLGDMDRKFEVYLEDSPDPLDLRMNASLLAGQRVIVKHYNLGTWREGLTNNREGEWLCTVRLEGGAGCSYFVQAAQGSEVRVWTGALIWTSSSFLVVFLLCLEA